MRSPVDRLSRLKQCMFALIIGINDYVHCRKLRGAVADANALKHYLEQVLEVPSDHIRTLFDRDATRAAIIQAFKDLQHDGRIKKGNPIVIFYAGHGGELPAPVSWAWWGMKESKIQCVLSSDYQGNTVPPIPDRTVGSLIEDIAKVRGDNITVIFDCCHSASGTRLANASDEYIPRTIELDHTISGDLDRDIWGERAGKIHPGFASHGLQSHVLLAACGESELAYEHQGRGQFTTALLETLGNCAIGDLTYAEVLEHIHLTRQNPHCEGFNQHRNIFDVTVPAGRQVRYPVRIDDGGNYVIAAGLAHGVKRGVEFTLYDVRKRNLGIIAVNDVAVIEDFLTTGTTSTRFTNPSFAKVTHVGDLPLYLTPGGNLTSVFEEIAQRTSINGTNSLNFRVVEDVGDAKLEIAMENDLIVFKVLDQQLKQIGMSDLFFETTLDRLTHTLGTFAHYYWYLDLTKKHNDLDTNRGVTVDFYLLRESDDEYDEYGMAALVPDEPGFCKTAENSNVIDFVVDSQAMYGIKLTNKTTRDLYLNAFLFNNSSLSIAPYYTQSIIGIPKAPLKRNATCTIGYGPEGIGPFSYSLEDGQDVDVGYLKIFFATRPIDLSDIVQPPLFSEDGQAWMDRGVRKASMKMLPPMPTESKETWFTYDIPVVQRRENISSDD